MTYEVSVNLNKVQYELDRFKETTSLAGGNTYDRSGNIVYWLMVNQKELGLSKKIREQNRGILTSKAQLTVDKYAVLWNQRYTTTKLVDKIREVNSEIDNILLHTLSIDDTIDFDSLKNYTRFEDTDHYWALTKELSEVKYPEPPQKPIPAPEPKFLQPNISVWDKVSGSAKQKIKEAKLEYERTLNEWKNNNEQINQAYENQLKTYDQQIHLIDEKRASISQQINVHKEAYTKVIDEGNEKVEEWKKSYLIKNKQAVEQYAELVLDNSYYPAQFPKEFEISYIPETGLIIIDYVIPSPDDLPREKDVKFVQSRNETGKVLFSEKEFTDRYNKVIYMTMLRTIHELFESDKCNGIQLICINGFINHLNKGTGNIEFKCIATLSVSKSEFTRINLSLVDPEVCFKQLKGISAKKLIDLTPVAPIIKLNKEDSRFIDGKEVIKDLDDSVNLASMPWEDFEHLIREIFAMEFSQSGGEVKVTQSSRDGGVDAVAFDPDPIRGGKIVIQAKRYTNVVGVSAVRDLYGTVVNEGATKGVLVTTSYYGKDAYEFARNKPLSLIDGSNLLYLLGKHGHKARINIEEAKSSF